MATKTKIKGGKTKKKTGKTRKVSRSVSVKKEKIYISGMPLANGIMLRSENNGVIVMRDSIGRLEIVSFKLKGFKERFPFLFLPFIRGVVIFIENIYFTLFAFSHKRSFIKKQLKQKTKAERLLIRINQYINLFVITLLLFGFFDYLYVKLNNSPIGVENGLLYDFVMTLFFLFIFSILFILLILDKKSETELLMYHGAEHQVISDYEEDKKIDSNKTIKKMDILHERCSMIVFIWTFIFLALFINYFNINQTNWFVSFIITIGFLLISFAFAYEFIKIILFSKSKALSGIFIKPFMWVQYFLIQKPDDNHIDVVKIALKEVLKMEGK